MKTLIAACSIAALLTGCATAPPAAPKPVAVASASSAKAKADPNAKICRSETDTGHMMGRRVCHTREEWAAMSAATQKDGDALDQAKRDSLGKGGNN